MTCPPPPASVSAPGPTKDKQPASYEPLTSEGMQALAAYIRKGVVTVLELHPQHGTSGIAQSGIYKAGDNINAEALVGTHCMWHTRGKSKWTFVHIDVDEWWTPLPFDTGALHRTLNKAYADTVHPPLALETLHITARVPTAPKTPMNVAILAADPPNGHDGTHPWGKQIYRPELVNVAWIHATANTATDNGIAHPNGQQYRESAIGDYRSAIGHELPETYFLHFSPSHWTMESENYGRENPLADGSGNGTSNFPTREFEFPADFRDQVLSGIRQHLLAVL